MHCTLLRWITVYCTALHCTCLHLISLYYTTIHFDGHKCTVLYPFHCNALHCTALHSIVYVQPGTGHCTAAVKRVKGGSNIWPQGAKTLRQKTVAPKGCFNSGISRKWGQIAQLCPALNQAEADIEFDPLASCRVVCLSGCMLTFTFIQSKMNPYLSY